MLGEPPALRLVFGGVSGTNISVNACGAQLTVKTPGSTTGAG